MESKILVSVIICTYNRAKYLPKALQSVCDQSLSKDLFEIIVVDNNCIDNTAEIVDGFVKRYSNIRYLKETNQGLSNARNCGWKEARGDYLAYIDDDVFVPRDWLMVAKHIIEEISPAAFGGPFINDFPSDPPKWFPFQENELPEEEVFLGRNDFGRIWGGNMFLKTQCLGHVGGFDPALGMVGEKISWCEDTAVMKAFLENNLGDLYFSSKLYAYNVIREVKFSWVYLVLSSFEAGRSVCRMNSSHDIETSNNSRSLSIDLFRILRGLSGSIVRALVTRNRNKYPYFQSYLYQHTLRYVRSLGCVFEEFCLLSRSNHLGK